MRRVLSILIVAGAACGPKVHPQATFDQDDPRAGAVSDAGVLDGGPVAIAAPPRPGLRTATVARAEVDAVLDAGPAALLRGLEVSALRPDGVFTGWQLVRFVAAAGTGHRFDTVDVAVGDVLTRINGHTLETPQDLSALWLELYRAEAIDVTLVRDGAIVTLHFPIAE